MHPRLTVSPQSSACEQTVKTCSASTFMIRIVGDGELPEAAAFYDVEKALKFDEDVYLMAMLAPFLKVPLKNKVIYNMEPLYDGCRSFKICYEQVLRDNLVLDYDAQNVEYLKGLGIEAFHLPYGFHQELVRP